MIVPAKSRSDDRWKPSLSRLGRVIEEGGPSRVPVPRPAAQVGDAAARGGLLAEGVHPKVVQERLGHSQISVTLDT
jgi:uncharacterized Zn-binding protein involved in type VI secretion